MLRGTLLDRYGFHGREHDSLTGLRHHRAREFNGQFWMSEDPIGFAAGDTNLYRFVGNGPGNATDPSGMQNGKQIKLEITKLPDGSFLVKMPDLSIRRVPNQKALDDLKRAYERNGEEEEPGPWEGGTGNNAPKSKVNPVEIPHETVHSEDKLKKSLPPVLQDHFGRTRNEIEAEKNACREPDEFDLDIEDILTVVGFVPVIGEVADIASGMISAIKGDWVGAGLSFLAGVPVFGMSAGAAKLARAWYKHVKSYDVAKLDSLISKLEKKIGAAAKCGDTAAKEKYEVLLHATKHAKAAKAPQNRIPGSSDAEHRIDEYLRSQGRRVDGNPLEGAAGAGRQGDRFIDGVKTEMKTLQPGATSSSIRNVVNNSIRGGGQARNIIIDARGSGLTREEAARGIARAMGVSRGRVDNIRIIGDGYDITN